MNPKELQADTVYAGMCGNRYDPDHAEPMLLVDDKPWIMEFWLPTRRLRRPVKGKKGEGRYGEIEGHPFPTAFRGFWVLVGSPQDYFDDLLEKLAVQAREEVGEGPADVPLLGHGVTSKVVLPYQLHLPWGDHLVQRAAAAA